MKRKKEDTISFDDYLYKGFDFWGYSPQHWDPKITIVKLLQMVNQTITEDKLCRHFGKRILNETDNINSKMIERMLRHDRMPAKKESYYIQITGGKLSNLGLDLGITIGGLNYFHLKFPEEYFHEAESPLTFKAVADLFRKLTTDYKLGFANFAHARNRHYWKNQLDKNLDLWGAEFNKNLKLPFSENPVAIFWMNFFGKDICDKIGREKLLKAPCYHVQEFADGILLFLQEEIFDPHNETHLNRQREIHQYLNLEKIQRENVQVMEDAGPPVIYWPEKDINADGVEDLN